MGMILLQNKTNDNRINDNGTLIKEAIGLKLFGDAYTCMICKTDIFENSLYCLCDMCLEKMPVTGETQCLFCGREIRSAGLSTVCHDCLQLTKNHYGGICCTRYEPLSAQLIFDYKYNDHRYIGRHMAAMMTDYVKSSGKTADLIIPVPATLKRLKVRGFHHTLYLAQKLSESLEIPLIPEALTRVHHTKRLKYLNREERLQTMADAFCMTSEAAVEVNEKHIFLVDDILTTGATLSACTKVLKASGAKEVSWLTFSGVV